MSEVACDDERLQEIEAHKARSGGNQSESSFISCDSRTLSNRNRPDRTLNLKVAGDYAKIRRYVHSSHVMTSHASSLNGNAKLRE